MSIADDIRRLLSFLARIFRFGKTKPVVPPTPPILQAFKEGHCPLCRQDTLREGSPVNGRISFICGHCGGRVTPVLPPMKFDDLNRLFAQMNKQAKQDRN